MHSWAPLYGGVVATVCLGTGVLIQPVARRLDRPGRVTAALVGLGALLVGVVIAILAARATNPALALVAGVPLGAAYGFGLVSGLVETQTITISHV